MSVSFLKRDFFTGSRNLPPGLYAFSFTVQMHQAMNKEGNPVGVARLIVMAHATPIDEEGNPVGDTFDQPLGLGQKAHESYQPDAETGKKLVPVPGGPASSFSQMCNFFIFLDSAYNSGMPESIVDDDLTPMDGMWARTNLIPAPADRKSLKSSTAENADEDDSKNRGPQFCVVITEILDNGKPWEGTGGLVEETKKKPGAKKPVAGVKPAAAAPKAAPKPVAKAAPAKPAAKKAAVAEEEDVTDAVSRILTDIFATNDKGFPRLKTKMEVFKQLKGTDHDPQEAVTTYVDDDDALNMLLQPLSFVLSDDGKQIVPAE